MVTIYCIDFSYIINGNNILAEQSSIHTEIVMDYNTIDCERTEILPCVGESPASRPPMG